MALSRGTETSSPSHRSSLIRPSASTNPNNHSSSARFPSLLRLDVRACSRHTLFHSQKHLNHSRLPVNNETNPRRTGEDCGHAWLSLPADLRDDHYRERVESFLHTSSIDVKNVMCTLSTEAAAGFEKTLAYSQAIDEGFTESWARDQFLVGGVRGDSDEGGDNDGDDGTLRKRRRQLVCKATANPNYALNFAAALRSERDKDAAAAGAGAGGDGGFGATGGASTRFSSSSPPSSSSGSSSSPSPSSRSSSSPSSSSSSSSSPSSSSSSASSISSSASSSSAMNSYELKREKNKARNRAFLVRHRANDTPSLGD